MSVLNAMPKVGGTGTILYVGGGPIKINSAVKVGGGTNT